MSTTQTTNKVFYVFPKLQEEMDLYGIPTKPSMADMELTSFLQNSDPKTVKSCIRTLVRVKERDGEKVFWYCELSAKGKDGNPVKRLVDFIQGVTYSIDEDEKFVDSEGNELKITKAHPRLKRILTQPFSKEFVEDLIEKATNTDLDKLQFSIEAGTKSYTVGSLDEFLECSYQELLERNKLGKIGYPIDITFSNMTGKDRLAMEQLDKSKETKNRK